MSQENRLDQQNHVNRSDFVVRTDNEQWYQNKRKIFYRPINLTVSRAHLDNEHHFFHQLNFNYPSPVSNRPSPYLYKFAFCGFSFRTNSMVSIHKKNPYPAIFITFICSILCGRTAQLKPQNHNVSHWFMLIQYMFIVYTFFVLFKFIVSSSDKKHYSFSFV